MPEATGPVGPQYEVPIDRSKVREFARATLTRNEAYAARDAVIPPTFLTTADFLWAPRGTNPIRTLGFDLNRQLHGEIEYVFHPPLPRAGETLAAQTRLDDVYEKPGKRGGVMRFAVLVTEFRDQTGRLVCEERSTAIETAKPSSEEKTG